jgi:ribosome maturation factor RimP
MALHFLFFGNYKAFPLPLFWKRSTGRERNRSLLLLPELNMEQQLKEIEKKVTELLENEPSYFLVEAKISTGNNVKVFIDADNGASIDKLVKYNRSLYKIIEESALFGSADFSLEVSSPGLDEPLKLQRQYIKNIGRDVEVVLNDGIKIDGKLLSVDENGIVVEEVKGKNKKKELVQHSFLFENIKNTKIQIKI